MLTEGQQALVKGLMADGYENASQIAKITGLTKEYVQSFVEEERGTRDVILADPESIGIGRANAIAGQAE